VMAGPELKRGVVSVSRGAWAQGPLLGGR